MINLINISKIYGSNPNITHALNNINISIKEGEFVSIMGPSGSGKSTLLNILGCLDKASSGEYYIYGNKVSDLSKNNLARIRNEQIGFIFQQFALCNDYTAVENVEMPLIYKNSFKHSNERLSHKKIRDLAIQKLELVGLKEHINKLPSQLSGGQQQRVAIARALICEPNIILADEPTGSLDQRTGKEIIRLLSEINGNGKTVIIITHDPNVSSYCQRKLSIVDGKIIDDSKIIYKE